MGEEFKLSLNNSHVQPFAFWFAVMETTKMIPESLSPTGNTMVLKPHPCEHKHTLVHTRTHHIQCPSSCSKDITYFLKIFFKKPS